ncbi:MAG: glutathione S-transferase family protein [Proteobacteria bacterium]|nr:glutathione S-transferase family protein [Pseudomonadota bacterium]
MITVISYAASYRHQPIELFGGDTPELLELAVQKTMNANSQTWVLDVVLHAMESETYTTALLQMDDLLEDFESILSHSPWLAGETYSLADVAYTSYLTRLELLQFHGMWQDRPNLAAYYARLKARPSYTEVIDNYREDFLEVLSTEETFCYQLPSSHGI